MNPLKIFYLEYLSSPAIIDGKLLWCFVCCSHIQAFVDQRCGLDFGDRSLEKGLIASVTV